jgi:hypothetical protein
MEFNTFHLSPGWLCCPESTSVGASLAGSKEHCVLGTVLSVCPLLSHQMLLVTLQTASCLSTHEQTENQKNCMFFPSFKSIELGFKAQTLCSVTLLLTPGIFWNFSVFFRRE